MLRLALPGGGRVTARFYGSLTSKSQDSEHFILYGRKGTLVITGRGNKDLQHYDFARGSWQPLTMPASAGYPAQSEQSDEQRNWNAVIQRFVDDIRGKRPEFYPTFEDAWVAAEIIDSVRDGKAWADVPDRLAH